MDWTVWISGVVLAAGAIAAYSRTFSVPFHFDDIYAIVENSTIRHWRTAFSPPFNTTASGRPVLNFSLALNYAISGTAVGSYHALNLAIHVLAGLTLFGILRRTFAARAEGPAASRIAFAASLLWLLHPLQTESVTYLVQRAESLMGLFYLLTLYCFIRSASSFARSERAAEDLEAGRRIWAVLSVLSCLFGMATKEVMVSAPVIVLLYDRTFLAGSFREAWRRRRGIHAGLAATWLILPFLVLSARSRGGTAGFGSGISWWRYALTQFPAIGSYLRLSVWPRPLIFDYGTEWVTGLGAVWPSALIVIGLLGATAWAFSRPGFGLKAVGFAGIWFFAILAPTSLIPGNRQTAAEHRMYLALIPVAVLTVIGIYRLLGRGALVCCLMLAVGLFGLTWQRNEDYRSALRLWSDTVAKKPANPWAHNNLGSALEKMPGRLDDAIAQYEEALRLKPDYADAHSNLGSAWLKVPGRLNDAIAEDEAALRLDPNSAEAHNNLGSAWSNVSGRLPDAIAQYEEALRLNPASAETHNNLGNAWLKMPERLPDAIAQYEEALRLNPASAEAHNNLGSAWAKMPERLPDAIAQYEEALRLKPGFAEAHNNLGSAWAKVPGKINDAIAQYEEAVRRDPDLVQAHYNLGVAWADMPGKLNDAIAQDEEAIRLKPDFAEAHYNLGVAWAKLPGRSTDAIAQYQAALRLKPDFAEAHNNLGTAWANTPGRLNDATAQLEAAVRLKPDNASFQFNLAIILLHHPDRAAEAAAHLDAVLRLQPGNDSARQILAQIRGPQPPTDR